MFNQQDIDEYEGPLLKSTGVYVIYKGKEGASNVVALRGINLEINRGDFLAIVGPSGSGKSSLLRCIGGLQHPTAGAINYYGRDITQVSESDLVPFRRSTVGFVFQEGNLIESLSGFQNVVRTLRYSGVGYSQSRSRATEILSLLGLKSRMHDIPKRLSGGERQRVAIARALANNPKIILADEPTGNIDYANSENVMGIFKDLHRDLETSFLVVTHSNHLATFANKKLELRDGRFTGQHTGNFDVNSLGGSRSVIISESGNLTLPPELLGMVLEYGNLWEFQAEEQNNQARIIAKPSIQEKLPDNCPVCKQPIIGRTQNCRSCGAKLLN
ncbi:MAG: ABC transporter ATP-binding protein [Candidatus Heimdallarchaeota archaeon]|nr:ABC transporter ATP-binding protein [Candidatus Heimdallarchaeota archaeon]MDH5644752.1 ABC transporter ATP-binding protein [Candidatus Heimdallarchaeota archaeon]